MGFNFLTRWSEVEKSPSIREGAGGLCIDAFDGEWYSATDLAGAMERHKMAMLISPELHGRPFDKMWAFLKDVSKFHRGFNLALCTDYPEKARAFFNE